MGTHLEKYFFLKSPIQGWQINRLTQANFNWLTEDPDRRYTARRYKTLKESITTVARIALSDAVDAFIIRERKHSVAIGLASIIFDQSVVHPQEGIVKGNNLDYWVVRLSSTPTINREVAERLVMATKEYTTEFIPTDPHGGGRDDDVEKIPAAFVAIQTDSKIPPIGFMEADKLHVKDSLKLEPLGEPAELSVPEGQEDINGIAAVGRITQLYYRGASRFPETPSPF